MGYNREMEILSGLIAAFLPAAVYVLVAVSPSTTSWTLKAYLAALIAPAIVTLLLGAPARRAVPEAAVVRVRRGVRASVWASLVVTLAAGVVVPKMMWAVRLKHAGFSERQLLRDRIEAYHRERGAFPATLDEVGPAPELQIWVVDEQERDHMHPATRRVTLHPGLERTGALKEGPKGEAPSFPAALRDDGSWGYDPQTGRAFVSCSGLEPKLRRNPLFIY